MIKINGIFIFLSRLLLKIIGNSLYHFYFILRTLNFFFFQHDNFQVAASTLDETNKTLQSACCSQTWAEFFFFFKKRNLFEIKTTSF